MADLPAFTMPADAIEKIEAKSKGVDYYADLTDAEREEEGLPPREAPKPEAAPAPAPAKPEPEPEDDPEPESDEAIERLFEEVAGIREDIGAALGKPEPGKTESNKDPLLEAALEHDDPVIRGLAERLQNAEGRLAARENEAREARINQQLSKDDAEFDAVQSVYAIGGKPMTDKQVEQVEEYILKNPELGRRLSIEQITRVVFPDATKVAKAPPATGPGASPNGAAPVATIVDVGASGGGTSEPFKPRPNETMESAVAEFARRTGWKR